MPDTAVEDALTIVTRLDPGLRHMVKAPAADAIQVLPHGDPVFGTMTDLNGYAE